MLKEIRDDYVRHGRSLRNRAVWALAVYRYGVWSLGVRSRPLRALAGGVYALLYVLSEIVTGVTLDRKVQVGEGLHIIHAATIFIHPDVKIGDRLGIMHNVTIGTNMGADVPVIGNDVFIGCGASILGRVRVGDGARIGANSLVISDVPAGAFAVGVPARAMKGQLSWRTDGQAAPRRLPRPAEAANAPQPEPSETE
jgi:serine O-acetyltransferase